MKQLSVRLLTSPSFAYFAFCAAALAQTTAQIEHYPDKKLNTFFKYHQRHGVLHF